MKAVGLRACLNPRSAPGEVTLLDLVRATDPFILSRSNGATRLERAVALRRQQLGSRIQSLSPEDAEPS